MQVVLAEFSKTPVAIGAVQGTLSGPCGGDISDWFMGKLFIYFFLLFLFVFLL